MSAATLCARKGRHRQRYDDHYRLVAGTDLVFPKGGWEDDETVAEAACREALEEAGVKGIISEAPLGDWIFRSKSSENSSSPQGACKGYIFALEVTEELEFWPEQANHGRQWVSMRDAYELSRYEWMREALDAFQKQLLGVRFWLNQPTCPSRRACA
uniref:Nudix hydrolase domain-containing protein n=1 Tax=Ananas comosus var. bracteatus TaxID=296719 RepID=A0A6V7NPN8_ANACO|nr:unnamed protein product [Ananas comosus var. bracteatus]